VTDLERQGDKPFQMLGPAMANDLSPCVRSAVENLAYRKDSFVNSRRQYKRHTRRHQHQPSVSEDRQNDVETGRGGGAGIHSCTVLDNFYVETPVWMIDLGKKSTVSGVIIVTWPGNPNGTI